MKRAVLIGFAPVFAFAGQCVICAKETQARCGRCKQSHYCSPACQKQDWPSHKATCSAVASAPGSARAGVEESKQAPAEAAAVVAIGENSARTGSVQATTRFETGDIIFCQVALFLSRSPDGHWDYHFAHADHMILADPGCQKFLKGLGGRSFATLLFAPAKTVARLAEALRKDLAAMGGTHVELVPYAFPMGDGGFTFAARLEGQTLTLDAAYDATRIARVIALGE
ncbi:MAG: zinc finger MYND domain-containing protein [Holophaga sp.]|nr:zinc finger MYND domain-containing protein [Holophaga sp.]